MKWIRKIKKSMNKNKKFDNKKKLKKNISIPQNQKKNGQATTNENIARYNYENYRNFKIYKRPIIKDSDEREQLFHKISEELRDLD